MSNVQARSSDAGQAASRASAERHRFAAACGSAAWSSSAICRRHAAAGGRTIGRRDLVEGAVALRFVATPWLSMQVGPHARRYDTPLGAERWVTWQLEGAATSRLPVRACADTRRCGAAWASRQRAAGFGQHARGRGRRHHRPGTPTVLVRLGIRIDQAVVRDAFPARNRGSPDVHGRTPAALDPQLNAV